jgi:hypothetical protein
MFSGKEAAKAASHLVQRHIRKMQCERAKLADFPSNSGLVVDYLSVSLH